MRQQRASATLALLAALVPLALAAGCASPEGLQNDGQARDVKAPSPLWPDHTPAPLGQDDNPVTRQPVPQVPRIPSGDMTAADPYAVLEADFTADGRTPPDPDSVRRPVLHDLTDDGKPDLITVVDLDRRTSELRVYSVRRQVVTRVLSLRGVLAGVELAAGHLAIREPTKDPRYVSVTDYVWDDGAMALWDITLDEARKPTATPSSPHSPSAPPSPSPPTPTTPTPARATPPPAAPLPANAPLAAPPPLNAPLAAPLNAPPAAPLPVAPRAAAHNHPTAPMATPPDPTPPVGAVAWPSDAAPLPVHRGAS